MTDRHHSVSISFASLYGPAIALVFMIHPALAITHEQIVEMCRQQARPHVQACVRAKRGIDDRESVRADCRRAVGAPIVQACVMREEQRIAAENPAPAPPKRNEEAIDPSSVPPSFVAPPRAISDITAILDSEKPDKAKIAALTGAADAAPPETVPATDLTQFYYDRGNARALLARNKEALADGLKALEVAKDGADSRQVWRVRQFVAIQYRALGHPKQAIAAFQSILRDAPKVNQRGAMINASRNIAETLVAMGNIEEAQSYAQRVRALVQEARGSPHPSWREAYAIYGNSWEADLDSIRALIFEVRGRYREAETAHRRAEAFRRASLRNLDQFHYPPPPEQILHRANYDLLSIARAEAKQGRLSEAEADARRALLGVLKTHGKYNPQTSKFIIGLAGILIEQGRYDDAEKLIRAARHIQRTLSISDDTFMTASILSQLGGVLDLQGKTTEATEIYAELDRALAQWDPPQRDVFLLNTSRIATLYASGQVEAGISAAQELVKRNSTRTELNHFDTASAHGMLGLGYARTGRDADAIREFEAAIPIMTATRENADDDDATVVAARSRRLQTIVEAYIGLLVRGSNGLSDVAIETFPLADAVRGHAVQQALTAASARMVVKDPALAELVRNEQDLGKQINAQLGALNNALALPSGERDEAGVHGLHAAIEILRTTRETIRQEIGRRFPSYTDFLDPKPPSVDQIRSILRADEVMLSFYFGQDSSFVWAIPKDGAVALAKVPTTIRDLTTKVRTLRESLEFEAERVSDIRPFDVPLAYELYEMLLKPIEATWKPAKTLIVATNGALGLLPLSLLPTALSDVEQAAQPLFSNYRNVAWLARTHAVTMVPSATALKALRQIPSGSVKREPMIGFGDPFFSKEQEEAAAQQSSKEPNLFVAAETRGVPLIRRSSPHLETLDSAELAMLPRLPDTAEELKSIALALEVDPAEVLKLGITANERTVKTTDLARYKVIVFATHGLIPGELNGLTQPALALTAPEVAGIDGDGLLTLDEILALKLDADWVVLSACNTGTGAGSGAEAASGLGRAFFYAGTRALLVTNWSVHSQSARELTSDLFRSQAADPKLPRSEALRKAMMALLDGQGFVDATGRTVFTYAHPLFWAPYTIIGDGG
jgi:CHAT domain-containing protein/tetratricopeptide (TPR) repeat protein